jgi:hypothetical protein
MTGYYIIMILIIILNIILSFVYINSNKIENYEYGIKLYRDTLSKQYAHFSKN